MKKVVHTITEPTQIVGLNKIKLLDEQARTCDYIIAYVSTGGLIAKLVSYQPKNEGWKVGFTYVHPNSTTTLSFKGHTHREAIDTALRAGREVMLFENEHEFLCFCVKHHAHSRNYWDHR